MQGQARVLDTCQSKDLSPTIPIDIKKEEKEKTVKDKKKT